jgi:hypothetical protein
MKHRILAFGLPLVSLGVLIYLTVGTHSRGI